MTAADFTSPTPSQDSGSQCRYRFTTWHCLLGVVLLLSPFLGFIISGMAILLLPALQPSARRLWFLKLVVSCVLLFGTRVTGAFLAYEWAYFRGYRVTRAATACGDEYLSTELATWCLRYPTDPYDLSAARFEGENAGRLAGIPEYTRDPRAAAEELLMKGCLFSTGLFRRVRKRDEPFHNYLERGLLFESDSLAIVFDGDLVETSDLRHLQGIAPVLRDGRELDYLEINSQQVSVLGLSNGRWHTWRVDISVLRVSESKDDRPTLQQLKRQRRSDTAHQMLLPIDDRDIDPQGLNQSLEAARKKRAEWKSRQPKLDQ